MADSNDNSIKKLVSRTKESKGRHNTIFLFNDFK